MDPACLKGMIEDVVHLYSWGKRRVSKRVLLKEKLKVNQETQTMESCLNGSHDSEMNSNVSNPCCASEPMKPIMHSLTNPKCSVCIYNPIDIVFIPCGHIAMCSGCLQQLKHSALLLKPSCPICRTRITKSIKFFVVSADPDFDDDVNDEL